MWVLYSLFFAIWSAIAILIVKRITKKIDPIPLLFIFFIFSIPFTFALVILTGEIPKVTSNFYLFMFTAALLDVVAFISLFKAIEKTQISIVSPISSFTPLFTTLIAAFALRESPAFIKLVGILLIVAGAYLLNLSEARLGILAPFKKLIKTTGVQLAFLSTFIWAITPIFQKKAIFETSPQVPLFAAFVGMCFVFIILLPFTFHKALRYKKEVSKEIKWFLLYGVGVAFAQLAAYTAFSQANVGYVATIMRMSGLFSVILGGTILKEGNMKERLIAAGIMIFGVLLLAL